MTKGQQSNRNSPNKSNGTTGSFLLKLFHTGSTTSKPTVAKGALDASVVSVASAMPVAFRTTSVDEKPIQISHQIQHTAQSTTPYVIKTNIFSHNNVVKTEKEIPLPSISDQIDNTPQLVLCASLFLEIQGKAPAIGTSPQSVAQQEWLQKMSDRPFEKKYLQQLINQMVSLFKTLPVKDSESIREIVLLGPVLDRKHFQGLLRCFLSEFDRNGILDVELLQGLVQLVQDAPTGFLQSDDMIEILRVIRRRLEDTAQQAPVNSSHLVLAATKVLNIMADNKVRDLDREFDHQPLLEALTDLGKHEDPFLKYRARIAGGLLKMSKVISLEFDGVPDAIPEIIEGGQGIVSSYKQHYGTEAKRPWYLAVRGAEVFVQERMFAGLNAYISEEACRHDPLFQWGICELLGRIALDPDWDMQTRVQAIKFLGEMCLANHTSGAQQDVRHLVMTILKDILDPDYTGCSSTNNLELLREEARLLVREFRKTEVRIAEYPYNVVSRLPHPQTSPLLEKVYSNPNLELSLERLRCNRRNDYNYNKRSIYIEAMSKLNLQASEDQLVSLKRRVDGFLESEREVMLILGDSGAGKSTFNLRLEYELWGSYQSEGPIPLFIDLKSVKEPDSDMIKQQLKSYHISKKHIEELRMRKRQFILICDGYDERRKWSNLHSNNSLNKSNNWHAKMIISCRTQYLDSDYRIYFEPQAEDDYGLSRGRKPDLYEEAVIVPFKMEQIKAYIDQHVSAPDTLELFEDQIPWTADRYLDQLKQIPRLMDLIRNPFLLRLMLDTLPRISLSLGFSQSRLTKVQLYDEYVVQHFKHELERLHTQKSKSKLSSDEELAFSEVKDDFLHNCIDFAARLAESIFMEQDGINVVDYSIKDKSSWKAQFFGLQSETTLLRTACPLLRSNNKYEFNHRSLLEYFFTCTVYEPRDGQPNLGLSACLYSSDSPSSLAKHPLNQRSLISEPSIIRFLAERVQSNVDLKSQLLGIVNLSKTYPIVSQASANSLTILVQAGVQFNGASLQGIQIAGADLSGGHFDSAELQNADLTGVNLTKTWLRGANFSNTQMSDVLFGEKDYLKVPEEAWCMALSPDRKILALGFDSGEVRVLATNNGTAYLALRGHRGLVHCVAFSSNGLQIASGGVDNNIWIWSLEDRDPYTLFGHASRVASVAFSPDGQQLVSGSDDNTVRVWDLNSKSSTFVLIGHSAPVRAVVWLLEEQRIVSGSFDGTLRLWQASSGLLERKVNLGSIEIWSLLYIPHTRCIVAGTSCDMIEWDLQTNDDSFTLKNHSGRYTSSLAVSPDNQRIVSASRDRSVKVWNEQTGELVYTFNGHAGIVLGVAFLSDYEAISFSLDGTLRVWELSVDAERSDTLQQEGHTGLVWSVAYSSDGKLILSGSADQTIREWDAETGCSETVSKYRRSIFSAAYSPDGDKIAFVLSPNSLGFSDRKTGDDSTVFVGGITVIQLSYSPCGRWLATGSEDGSLQIWDLQFGAICALEEHTEWIRGVTFAPNGLQFASWSNDRTVRFWDTSSDICEVDQTQILEIHAYTLVYSPCGKTIAWSGESFHIYIWDVKSEEEQSVLKGHIDRVECLAWSSEWIVSGGKDATVRLWKSQTTGSAATWTCVAVIQESIGQVMSLAWNPVVPLEFVCGSFDSSLCVWKVTERDSGEVDVRLKWGLTDRLVVTGAKITDAIGLDDMQRRLLQQRGAIYDEGLDTPAVDSEESEELESQT